MKKQMEKICFYKYIHEQKIDRQQQQQAAKVHSGSGVAQDTVVRIRNNARIIITI